MISDTDTGAAAAGLTINGVGRPMPGDPTRRLSDVLRGELGLTGTKVGCEAGDCGACTVHIDGEQVCACLVPVGQLAGRRITTVEGLGADPLGSRLQRAFAAAGATQCGICTPGMLMAAADLLRRVSRPDEAQVLDAIGGVLCRCTGYRKIVTAVLAAARDDVPPPPAPGVGQAVGARLERLDGPERLDGRERYGADQAPDDAIWLRVVRSPHAAARVRLGDLEAFVAAHPGLVGVITAEDIPNNRFAIFPDLRDQPALADGEVRFVGEAVLALAGARDALESLAESEVPIEWTPLEPVDDVAAALAEDARQVNSRYPGNLLCRGRVARGDCDAALSASALVASGSMLTRHVEHAYIEPEAGWARWNSTPAGNEPVVTVFACTQTPYMDRDELAWMFGVEPERVRVVPSAVGGGFGGKLDLSVQPLLVAAARRFGTPARIVYTRAESMSSTTKRHPARMRACLGVDASGGLSACDFFGDFDTGPYASWGPTVANRVPIHACGPYRVDSVRALTRAVVTNGPVGGAFRGFGVPQSTLLVEALVDELAHARGEDPLEFRYRNALRAGDVTATGQVLAASVGLQACLDALRPAWAAARQRCRALRGVRARTGSPADPHGGDPRALRRGVGMACMWYGIGNTVIANPSTMRLGLRREGRFVLYNGAVDIGQGTYTIMPQIAADALGVPVALIDQVRADTALTADAGKSSASRQTFVSGNAVRAAGLDLRRRLCALLGCDEGDAIALEDGLLRSVPGGRSASLALAELPVDEHGDVAVGEGRFDPPTVPLDADGQGVPYATYGFAAQFAEVEVDIGLGTVRVLGIHAAHDVGRAINPTQVEGQIHGGIAQGIGLALMECYRAGRTDNLHDYLIPTAGDVPPIHVHLIEDPEPLGPHGAKGVGEPALIATAPAILNAIRDAIGVRLEEVPATPEVVRLALAAGAASELHSRGAAV